MIRLMTICLIATVTPQATTQLYRDARGRFTFAFPVTFGTPSPGTNDGFGDRFAAIHFSDFPAALKGEAVLTRGFPLMDFQAVGGLYDAITLEIFPDRLRALVLSQLPRLSAANLCEALARPTHLDPNLPAFAVLTAADRAAIGHVDAMRNVSPHVLECRVNDDVVVFDKERATSPGGPVQHVFGAVRFLPPPFSSFQVVAGGARPDSALLTALTNVVRSLTLN